MVLFGRKMSILYVNLGVNYNLHMEMINNIMRAKLQFFQKNPNGRILTRFSKDAIILDTMFFSVIVTIITGILRCSFVVVSVAILNPYTLIAFAVSGILMVIILKIASKVL